MTHEPNNSSTQKAEAEKPFRPALIASQRTITDYPLFLKHLLAGLTDESIPTALVCPPNFSIESIMPPTVEVIRYPAVNLPLMTHFNKKILIELLKKFEPTVLHCLCERNALITKQLARNMQLPYVLTINSLQKRWKQHSVSLKRCAQIIVPSKRIAENIAEVQPRLVDRIRQINIGTFPTETPHCFSNVSQLASIVVAHPVKNADDLANFLGAVRHLAIQGYEFMLIIIGIGKVERQLRKLLDSLDLSQITTISSRLQPWRSILAAGDIFVEPLPTDTFNPMVLEAMSVGTAVATCRGGVDDLITEDHTAVVFDHNDELSIYNCLEKLFARRELAQQLAANAQEYLRENHTVSKMITDTIETYRQAQHHRQ